MLGLLARPAASAPRPSVDYVIIAGAPGLRWDDVSPTGTPTLWALAQRGTIGALSVRSAHKPTCPADGWVTLGAGNYAQRTPSTTVAECPPLNVTIETPDRIGAYLPDQRAVVLHNQEKLPWGAVPGALAESVRCTTAVGPGAAVAAARPFGRVDRYTATLPENPVTQLAACRLGIVDLGTVAGEDPARRLVAAQRADRVLARVLAARPERSLVLVAGLSDTDLTSRLHVAIADGPGWTGGWLTSASTSRPGYLPLVDLAPTALAALDELGDPEKDKLFAGHPADRTRGRPADLVAAVARLADADREAGAQHRVASRFFTLLAALQVLLFAAAVPLLRRARRHGKPLTRPLPPVLITVAEVVLVAAAVAIPAALLADALPWWRSARPGLLFTGATMAAVAAGTAAIMAGPLRRRTLGPLVGVAVAGVAVVAADLLTGARLQLNGVAGYSALEGGRYAGVGTVGLGVFLAGLLLGAGYAAQRMPRRWRPPLVVFVGALGVVLVGSPYLGADAGGAVALTAGVCIAAALSTGGWLTFARLAWAMLAGLAVTTGFALLDLRRPAEQRGSLGRFMAQLSSGSSGPVVHRTGAANVVAFATSPLTVLAIAGGLFVWFALLRDWGGLKRLFGLYPAVRAGFAGVAVASVIGGLFNEAALNVAGAAAATAVPLAALAALRVLGHADDRTVVPDPTLVPEPKGPGPEPERPAPEGPAEGPADGSERDSPHPAARAPATPAADVLP
ncbi:MAG TPA: hypothetical protein VFE14_15090 [Micromonosporaceae bacterium]|nr:hypothetical protein [Micromonosporaceae bacterium]